MSKKVTPSTQATCKKVPLPASFECIELQSRGRNERKTLRIGVLKHWPAKQMLRIIIFYELFRRNVFEMTRRRLRSKSPKKRKQNQEKPKESAKLWRVFHCVGFKGCEIPKKDTNLELPQTTPPFFASSFSSPLPIMGRHTSLSKLP